VIRDLASASLRHRRGAFAAAFAAVSIGALAVTATASALIAALSPGGHPLVDGGSPLLQAQNMAGQSTALVACTVAVVVAATFAVMIEQRRRELALLSLIGALPRQIRRLVITEAVLLAVAAAVAGCVLGTVAAGQLGRWMDAHHVAPAWFRVGFSPPAVLIAFTLTVAMAALGAVAVAVRASLVRPVEAVRESAVTRAGMTWIRWLLGLGLLAGAAATAHVVAHTDPQYAANPRKYLSVPALYTAGFALLVPLLSRPAAGVFARSARVARRPGLLAARLRRAGRSVTAAAFPVALAIGLAGTLLLTGSAANAARIARLAEESGASFVVVPGQRAPLPAMNGVPGASIAMVTSVPVTIATVDGEQLDHLTGQAVNNEALGRTLTPTVLAGALPGPAAGNDWIVIDQRTAQSDGITLGQRLLVTAPERPALTLTVRAIIAPGLTSDDTYVPSLVAAGDAPQIGYVRLAPGGSAAAVRARLAASYAADGARIQPAPAYFAALQAQLNRKNSTAAPVIIGISVLYCLIAVANTLVMTTLGRRRELAVLGLAGLTRGQAIRSAAAEAVLAVVLGAIPAGLAMAATAGSQRTALLQLTSAMTVPVPWPDIIGVTAVCLLVAAGTSAAAAARLTATPPIELAGQQE
jgi:putative ABC transport system permease protein